MIAHSYIITASDPQGGEDLLAIPGQMALIFKRHEFQAGARTHLSIYNAMYDARGTMSGHVQYKWYAAHYARPLSIAGVQTDPAAEAGNGCGCCKYTFSGSVPGINVEMRRSGFVSPMDMHGVRLLQFVNLQLSARMPNAAMHLGTHGGVFGQTEVRNWRPVIMAEVPSSYSGPTIQLYDIVERRMVNAIQTPIPFVFSSVTQIAELKKLGLDGLQAAMEDWYYNVLAYMTSIDAHNLYVWHQEDVSMLSCIETSVNQETAYTISEAKQLRMRTVPGVSNGSIADANRSSIFRWISTPGDRHDVFKSIDLEARHKMLEALGMGEFRDTGADGFLS